MVNFMTPPPVRQQHMKTSTASASGSVPASPTTHVIVTYSPYAFAFDSSDNFANFAALGFTTRNNTGGTATDPFSSPGLALQRLAGTAAQSYALAWRKLDIA